MQRTQSLLERTVANPRYAWISVGAAVIVLAIPVVIALWTNNLEALSVSGEWRGLLVAPIMILYSVLASIVLELSGKHMYESLRPVVLVTDEAYAQLILSSTAVSKRNELLAIVIGAIFGVVRTNGAAQIGKSWVDTYLVLTTVALFALLAWVIYDSLASERATGMVLKQPLTVDPTEISAFEPIGRQGFFVALFFVGGISLSLVSSALEPSVFTKVDFWLVYIPLILVPIGVFIVSMLPTHRVLAAAKARELKIIRSELRQANARLRQRLDQDLEMGTVTQEIAALWTFEQRLQAARTWPYNTTMLRTLFVSVLVPAALLLARTVIDRYWN